MRLNTVILVSRLVGDPIQVGELVHFRLENPEGQPFHLIAREKTATNVLQYCRDGDEVSVEGRLVWKTFANSPKPVLIVEAKYISYGRKKQSLRQVPHTF
jgi:hypothetical protein